MRVRLLVVILCSVTALPATAQARLPSVLTQHTKRPFEVRPATIWYTGDGTGVIGGSDGASARYPGRLHWNRYSHRQGRARGLVWLNDCDPSCAEGTFSAAPVNVHVFAPRHGHFTRLTLKYAWNGTDVTDQRSIKNFGSYWAYGIIKITPATF